jgi:hypothetical protein
MPLVFNNARAWAMNPPPLPLLGKNITPDQEKDLLSRRILVIITFHGIGVELAPL